MAVLDTKAVGAACWIIMVAVGLDAKILYLLVMNTSAHLDIFISLNIIDNICNQSSVSTDLLPFSHSEH